MSALRLPLAQLAWLLIAFALLMRAAVPAGWMPVASANGPTITLCTGLGMVEAWFDASGKIHKSAPHHGEKESGACAFSGLGLALDVAAPPYLPGTIAERPASAPATHLADAVGRGLAAPPPPATGPPALI
jgi:hypothetical protein